MTAVSYRCRCCRMLVPAADVRVGASPFDISWHPVKIGGGSEPCGPVWRQDPERARFRARRSMRALRDARRQEKADA